jgi:CHASE2 domain-containing sensor protein
MLKVIILANLAAVSAFLFGASKDWSPVIPKSAALNRCAAAITAILLSFALLALLRRG